MNAYEILLELKQDIIEENRSSRLTLKDLFSLRKCLSKINNSRITLYGLEESHDIVSFLSFYGGYWQSNLDRMQFIAEKFDPILNLFLEENYVVTIRRVDSTDKINDFDDDFVNKIEQMKIAYQNKNFEEVTIKK